MRQNYEGVEDIKLSGDICYAHGDIPKAMGDILKVVGLETDESANTSMIAALLIIFGRRLKRKFF